ncbi:hypothetical protein HJG60_010772 [Phyllostomus discolor]|uniref:Uncharacterized protein n=1 Tax=Phyllostomus discolor TaxID=89673 RepID=A0A834AEH1_9CHIR|nr:hypothetical protein HJG60_010772 [Phyllostomus discolor]
MKSPWVGDRESQKERGLRQQWAPRESQVPPPPTSGIDCGRKMRKSKDDFCKIGKEGTMPVSWVDPQKGGRTPAANMTALCLGWGCPASQKGPLPRHSVKAQMSPGRPGVALRTITPAASRDRE